jgi:hypothetical protein
MNIVDATAWIGRRGPNAASCGDLAGVPLVLFRVGSTLSKITISREYIRIKFAGR